MTKPIQRPRRDEVAVCGRPVRDREKLWVDRLKGNDRQNFVVASPKIWGYYTHWIGERNVPCWENHDFCEGGHKEESLRQNYLVQCWSKKRNKMVFVYLTPGAMVELEDLMGDAPLAVGTVLEVTRTTRDNGLLHVAFQEFSTATRITSRTIDPWESIMNFLKVPLGIREQHRSLGTIPLASGDLSATG